MSFDFQILQANSDAIKAGNTAHAIAMNRNTRTSIEERLDREGYTITADPTAPLKTVMGFKIKSVSWLPDGFAMLLDKDGNQVGSIHGLIGEPA